MVEAPELATLWAQRRTETQGQVIVDTDRAAPQSFPYTVESVVFQVTGQVRFRPLQPLDLERTVEDMAQNARPVNVADEPVAFGYPYDSNYKGLDKVGFPTRPSVSTP
jgi:hypothetical protein